MENTWHRLALIDLFVCDVIELFSPSLTPSIDLWNVFGDSSNYGCIKGHTNAITQVQWSRDSLNIYTSSADRCGRVFDAETGECTATLAEHTGSVFLFLCFLHPLNPRARFLSHHHHLQHRQFHFNQLAWRASRNDCVR